MDKKKQNKEEKVGADGLTKKERRALKVQARQTDDNKAELKNNKTNTTISNIPEIDSNRQSEEAIANKDVPVKKESTVTVKISDENVTPSLSEKEKRKLEWEKKLAEQKNQVNDLKNQGLSKAEQKAKRREIQESQRLLKAKVETEKSKTPDLKKKVDPKPQNTPAKSEVAKPKLSPLIKTNTKKFLHSSKVQLLNHLYSADSKSSMVCDSVSLPTIHPAFIQLGVQYSTRTISGSNARCVSLLFALKSLVRDLKSPNEQDFCRYLESVLQSCTDYLQKCRPMAVSMTNALRVFKIQLTQIERTLSDEVKANKLVEFIDTYIHDEILTAGEAISLRVFDKIASGDTILIYGCSSLIRRILLDAFKKNKQFKVIVVDSRPLLEGKEMLRRLTEAGISCTYILINALGYVMSSVNKVLLGTHALLTNGYVMSRAGTSQVAMVAQAYNKPVLVCCETYKFSERVQTDSLIVNEIGDPDSLVKSDNWELPSPIQKWKESNKLTPLNLFYDVTPPDLVTAVVTELAILPCTSVPVVLRLKPIEV